MSVAARPRTLVVIPNDPIHLYEEAGYEGLRDYFNPMGLFDEVIVLSPLERGERRAWGMHIRGVAERDFRRALKAIRPAVVRAYAGDWPADLACHHRIADVPIVVSVHDLSRARMHDSVRYADLVVATSNAVAARLQDVGVDPARLRVIPNRVDTMRFRAVTDDTALARIASRFPPGRHVLHVGRKVDEKNLDTVIRALALLPRDVSAVFVGRGDQLPYRELARRLDVSDRCFWIEAIPNSELPAWYSWCDCFCVPSRSEGFGTVFIEAAACGAAIVTSDVAPMNTYLEADVNASLVAQFTDPAAVAEAVRRVCEDVAYRDRIRAGAVIAARRFDKRLVDAEEVAVYLEALTLSTPSLARRLAHWRWGARRMARENVSRWRRAARRVGYPMAARGRLKV